MPGALQAARWPNGFICSACKAFQRWLQDLWRDKDARIEALIEPCDPARRAQPA